MVVSNVFVCTPIPVKMIQFDEHLFSSWVETAILLRHRLAQCRPCRWPDWLQLPAGDPVFWRKKTVQHKSLDACFLCRTCQADHFLATKLWPIFFAWFLFFKKISLLSGGLSGCGLACHSEWHAHQVGEAELFFVKTPDGPMVKDADA